MMRKILILLLISIHLAGNTEAGQLFRLPRLLAHFTLHHELNTRVSFGEFMLMHYGGDDGTNADDDADRQLPFRDAANSTCTVVYSPMVNDLSLPAGPQWPSRTYKEKLCANLTSKHVQRILQPPRIPLG